MIATLSNRYSRTRHKNRNQVNSCTALMLQNYVDINAVTAMRPVNSLLYIEAFTRLE
jgi:hypothetical protein